MSKLPGIALSFWIIWIMKICATTLGETAGDLLSMTMNVGYATSSAILIEVFLTTLVASLMSKSYHPLTNFSQAQPLPRVDFYEALGLSA